MAECPAKIVKADAAGDPGILINVTRVIVVNEIVAERLRKHRPCNYCKAHADSDECPVRRQLTCSYLVHDCDCENPNDKIITNGDDVRSPACSFVLRYLSFLGSSFVDQNISAQLRRGCW